MTLRWVVRVPAAVTTVAVLATAGIAGAAWLAAPARAAAPCVGVIVDASRAGGTVRTGCARTDPRNGLVALRAAGFTLRLRPDGLVCQINRRPATCAASTQRYWSYWYRNAGSSRWIYSSIGPGARDPKPGSTDAWVFQTGGGKAAPPRIRQSRICPVIAAPARASTYSPRPATTSRTSGRGPGRARAPARRPSSAAAVTRPTPSSPTAAARGPTHRATAASMTPAPAGDTATATRATRTTTSEQPEDGGPPWGLVAGAALIGAVGAAAARRARRPPSGPR